jgi:hypothetical protein
MKRLVPIVIALSLTILLANIAAAQKPSLVNAHLSDTPDGPAMTQFPSGTTVVYAIFDYADMAGETVTVRVYPDYYAILFEQTKAYTGAGTESVATGLDDEEAFPDGQYATNFYIGGYLARTILWDVGAPPAMPVATPTTTSPAANLSNQVKDLAVPAAFVLLIILVVLAIYRVLTAR